jgi:hypothetical protein
LKRVADDEAGAVGNRRREEVEAGAQAREHFNVQ